MTSAQKTRPPKTEAIAGRVIPWTGDQLGIAYDFAGGRHYAHPIEESDWPVIRRLEAKGKLGYSNDRVREIAARQRGEAEEDWGRR
jgi:hypothetical protein